MRRISICLLPVLLGTAWVSGQTVIGPWIPKFKGVDLSISTNIPPSGGDLERLQVVSALRIDLTDPDVEFFTTPRIADNYVDGSREIAAYTVSDFLRNNHLQAAINANYFSEGSYYLPAGTPMDLYGLAISQGVVVSSQDTTRYAASLVLDQNNFPTVIHTNWPAVQTDGIYTAVTGKDAVLLAGQVIGRDDFDVDPRTAFGISEERRYVYLLAIDGRQPGYSEGANDYESGYWLKLLGAYDGINMDGGGSTTLVLEDSTGVPIRINRSSAAADSGRERTVGSHIGIYAKPVRGFFNDLQVNTRDTTATITWTTMEPARTEGFYGLTSDLGASFPAGETETTEHTVELTGLTPETGYYYRLEAMVNEDRHISPLYHFATTNFVVTNLVFDLTSSWKHTHWSKDGENWTSPAYDDSNWSGPGAGLLWVDERSTANANVQPKGEQMTLNPDTGYPYPTYYFRRSFLLEPMQPGSSLLFSTYVDDGAVFYLNGVELHRLRVPVGASYSTLATGYPCAGNADCPDEFRIPVESLSSLVAGENLLAAEVHNYNARSSDITFGLALSRIDPVQQSDDVALNLSFSGGALQLSWQGTAALQWAPAAGGPWTDLEGASAGGISIQPAEARRFYRLRR